MATKLTCDVCGKEINRYSSDNSHYTYDMVIKKRNGAIYGEAHLDICEACLNEMNLLEYIKPNN